ncbi:hypothetical protein EZS27_001906 [termite gut metagenome]|uniref:Uncharacterized protein n=1 Tax=termite gut metagenome TaxID=433724 RepID=A0A5J4SXS6_9ZZZZ
MDEKIIIYFTEGHVVSDDEEIRYQIKWHTLYLRGQGKTYDKIVEYLNGIFEGDKIEIENLVKIYFYEANSKCK